jgi:2-polyprenyl-6-methoxyphenol hydroxylase-like FAD-dependent oxidoreductase
MDEHVVIAGAGPAGLAAAWRSAGLAVTRSCSSKPARSPRPGIEALAGHLVTLDRRGMPAFTGAGSSPELPGLWFFGLDSSIYGNMHVRRRQARQLARAITG